MQAFGSAEVFMIWLKAGVVAGFIIASPWIFWQLWSFVASGLYPHEKHYVYIYLPFSLSLFVAGVLLAYFFVFRFVLDFLFDFNLNANIPIDPRISEWIGFVLILPLGFGLSFQLPLVMLFLERIGLFETRDYLAKWRVAVVVIFLISMLLTPADPMSMMLMARPAYRAVFPGRRPVQMDAAQAQPLRGVERSVGSWSWRFYLICPSAERSGITGRKGFWWAIPQEDGAEAAEMPCLQMLPVGRADPDSPRQPGPPGGPNSLRSRAGGRRAFAGGVEDTWRVRCCDRPCRVRYPAAFADGRAACE